MFHSIDRLSLFLSLSLSLSLSALSRANYPCALVPPFVARAPLAPFLPRLYAIATVNNGRDKKTSIFPRPCFETAIARPTIESKVNDVELISRCASQRSQPLWINYAIEYPLLRVTTWSKKERRGRGGKFLFFPFLVSFFFFFSPVPTMEKNSRPAIILLLSTRNTAHGYIYAYRSPVSPYANPLSQLCSVARPRRAYATNNTTGQPYAYSFPLKSDWKRQAGSSSGYNFEHGSTVIETRR